MFIIKGVLISDEVVSQQFMCNLNACLGACCWEGDYGAPLAAEELEILQRIYPDVALFLTPEGRAAIEEQGVYTYYEDADDFGTPLVNGGACAYMTRDAQGTAQCGIEQSFRAGATDFQKPISCHLYPVRATAPAEGQLETLNYERWEICSAACEKGKQHQIPVYKFVQDALVRKYGHDFFEALDAAAQHLKNTAP